MTEKWAAAPWHAQFWGPTNCDEYGMVRASIGIWSEPLFDEAYCDHEEEIDAMDRAWVCGIWGEVGDVENANAQLIATAPDLYKELQEARTDLVIAADNADDAAKTDSGWTGVGEKLRARAREADKVLRKARGETE